jgi:hypothetical protein
MENMKKNCLKEIILETGEIFRKRESEERNE